ncbi:MAG: TatD family hydrolase [Verrucomicrobiota bacterium]
MSPSFYDAHVHLASPVLSQEIKGLSAAYDTINLNRAIVVGTSPDDWAQVLDLAGRDKRFVPAVGLHPWHVNEVQNDWQGRFLSFLDKGISVIGEIGLDQWVDRYDIELQREAFEYQLAAATERNLPTSIHCLKAHQPLMEVLRGMELPKRGFKLHAYNGPIETMKPLLDLGAHFSFNAGQLKPNAKRVCELIKLVPDERLLIETDAPDFLPPRELQEFQLGDPNLCHPANIRAGYRALATLRGCRLEIFAESIGKNFLRYFMDEFE